MIPESAILEWANTTPWNSNEQVEQDLIICRALVEIFRDEYLASHLAFRGGTALHKLYLHPHPRYSEDIDLVQIKAEPIKDTIVRLSEVLSWLGKPVVKQKANNNTLIFRFHSEIAPVLPIRLKVEINCREHFSVLGLIKKEYAVNSRWFTGTSQITTYFLDELLGTKLRALYQRRKGRDLFDLYMALDNTNANSGKIIKCYREYMNFAVNKLPTQKEFFINMEAKIVDKEFLGDTKSLLRGDANYNPQEAYELVKASLIELL
jgi:predicted nucleotidyltransferase component of viral defense system